MLHPVGRDVGVNFLSQLQWHSYTRAHMDLGPGKLFEVNVPEPSGVARNGPCRAQLHENQAYTVIFLSFK